MKVTVPVTRRVKAPLGDAAIGKTVRAALLAGTKRPSSLRVTRAEAYEVSIAFVSDAEMTKLNDLYRGKCKTTDVLSFSISGGQWPAGGDRELLGDVIISVAEAGRQAKAAKKPIRSELTLLLIHGVLHLLGYDHEKIDQEKIMFPLQQRILKTLGYA
jgi:rRNA maturation RNase YbeY